MSAPSPALPSPALPFPRVAPNQWHAFGGVWRLTYRRWLPWRSWLVCAGLLGVLAGIAATTNPKGDASAYFDWFGSFFLGVLVPILAFLSGAGALRDDLKPGAVDYLFTRPVRRPVYLVSRYVCHLACAQLTYLSAFGVMVAVGIYREIPGLAAGLPLLLLAQVLTVAAFVALGVLCAVVVSRYLIVGLCYAGLVEAGAGLIPTQLNRLSMTRQIRELLEPLAGAASVPAGASVPAVTALPPGAGPWGTALHLGVFAVVFVALAALVFSRKEFSGAPGRE